MTRGPTGSAGHGLRGAGRAPPITGLHTSILCLLGYAAFGPSRILVLGPEGLEGYHDTRSYPAASHLPGLVIYRFDAPLVFANAKTFRDEVMRMAQADLSPRWILIAAEPMTDVDTTASDVLGVPRRNRSRLGSRRATRSRPNHGRPGHADLTMTAPASSEPQSSSAGDARH